MVVREQAKACLFFSWHKKSRLKRDSKDELYPIRRKKANF